MCEIVAYERSTKQSNLIFHTNIKFARTDFCKDNDLQNKPIMARDLQSQMHHLQTISSIEHKGQTAKATPILTVPDS